ncbi:MAG TPA: allantoinase AllB [Pyrinomonadaceae bacterium]|nr:allantoinase AllB [Pyrinomonadaceae bacterium]
MSLKIIRSRKVVTPTGLRPATVRIENGSIEHVGEWTDAPDGADLVDAGEHVVMPGLVDSHVHVNEPGRTNWEGYESATRAAAAGGVTTIVDMPLNSIPATTTLSAFEEKLSAAEEKCTVDVAFWGGVVPGNVAELAPLVGRGVRGFKCFLIHSGVDEFPHVSRADLRIAMPELARLDSVLLVHAELEGPVDAAAAQLVGSDPREYDTFLRSRPRAAEDAAVELMIELCRETGTAIHIVHHSSSDSLDILRAAKSEGLPITVETCPHYLTFAAEDIADGSTHFKCCPPVRERENREKLWEAVADGTIDMIVSDHSPCTPELKRRDTGDFMEAWGGISALQFGLPVMWTNFRSRGFGLTDMTRLLCEGPARLAGLDNRKGMLAPGFDADIVVWDPDKRFTLIPELIQHRHKLTPYSGMELFGSVLTTYVGGKEVYTNGKFANTIVGKLIV